MKIKNTSNENVHAWLAPTGFFAPGMVREVPARRIPDVQKDMARGRLAMFEIVSDDTPTNDPVTVDGKDMKSDRDVRVRQKPIDPPPPPPPPPPALPPKK